MSAPRHSLPHSLSGERREIRDQEAGLVSYYVDGLDRVEHTDAELEPPPLLLIHSINAAASAHEVKPVYDAFKTQRPTYAIDLPGFGHSERSERFYGQDLMVAALEAVIAEIRATHGPRAIDALAISLASEFLAKTASAHPVSLRSLAMVSPTGFAENAAREGRPDESIGRAGLYRFLSTPLLGRGLFRLLTTPPSIRFFLRRTWGSKQIDEKMFRVSCRVARFSGAHHAPFHFIAGYLFSADIAPVYRALKQPVWLSRGVRGAFDDYERLDSVENQPNWHITTFQTGAMPHFERPSEFLESYQRFIAGVAAAERASGEDDSRSPQP
jgi:pimeloyl-ACP methyl ester carboxylesterase